MSELLRRFRRASLFVNRSVWQLRRGISIWMKHTGKKSPWKRNLAILWGCTFIAGIAFSEIMPFMSLYVSELGNFTKAQVSFYSGLVYAATFLVTAIVSPIWGALADRKGRKIMLIRASFGMATAMFLMGLVSNVWQLLALRAYKGYFPVISQMHKH